jgi:hypothetical protein
MTHFSGARLLKPVDDFYDAVICELSDFISRPKYVNLEGDPHERVDQVIARIKTVITEHLRNLTHERFFFETNMSAWHNLYMDGGVGVDLRRRSGIIAVEKKIAPDEMDFLLETTQIHIIDKFEEIFRALIKEVGRELFPDK